MVIVITEAEKAVKNRKETLGMFNHIPFYVKLHEAIKGAHLNYKVINMKDILLMIFIQSII